MKCNLNENRRNKEPKKKNTYQLQKFHVVILCSKNAKVLVDNVIRYNFAHSYPNGKTSADSNGINNDEKKTETISI